MVLNATPNIEYWKKQYLNEIEKKQEFKYWVKIFSSMSIDLNLAVCILIFGYKCIVLCVLYCIAQLYVCIISVHVYNICVCVHVYK